LRFDVQHQSPQINRPELAAPEEVFSLLLDAGGAMLFWALLASGQITMRKVDGWQSLTQKLADQPIDLAA